MYGLFLLFQNSMASFILNHNLQPKWIMFRKGTVAETKCANQFWNKYSHKQRQADYIRDIKLKKDKGLLLFYTSTWLQSTDRCSVTNTGPRRFSVNANDVLKTTVNKLHVHEEGSLPLPLCKMALYGLTLKLTSFWASLCVSASLLVNWTCDNCQKWQALLL